MVGLIRSIQATGITVLLVEHNMGLIMDVSDRILVLNYGQKLAEGIPSEIQRNKAVIDAYLGNE
jgi:branched-chain amino acid transport system ATP-binding protein